MIEHSDGPRDDADKEDPGLVAPRERREWAERTRIVGSGRARHETEHVDVVCREGPNEDGNEA